MIDWTETARRTLDEYCARAKATLAGTGADAEEVADDIRRHVDEEASAAGLKIVTETDIRRILARFGEPGSAIEKQAADKQATVPPREPDKDKKRPGFILLTLGVVLPLATVIFELITGASAGVLFDPLPSWIHIAAVSLVPATNFWIWRAGRARDSRHDRLLGWLNGIALGICVYYLILYLPIMPFATIGIIYFGLGLIPMTPLIALVATSWMRLTYARRIAKEKLPGAAWGAIAGFGFLFLLQLPVALTYYGLARASAADQETRLHGVRVLRMFGDEQLMLRVCYGLLWRDVNFDVVRMVASGNNQISSDQARAVYYQVTGRPFNSVPSPSLYTRRGRWNPLEQEFEWDGALGGETVAGRVKGLSLLSSRMDAVAEPDASLVYCEWTLEFKNVATQQREARAQIALPPGAVVSRLTLWINGEEREAAFSGRSQVRQAYQQVAVVQRRDPVLVTTCGPDRVLVQCFPVPPNGGVMKVRIGITAPLILDSLEQGRFVWPHFLERNFGIASEFKHALWIESPGPLSGDTNAVVTPRSNTRPFSLHESLPESDSGEGSKRVVVHRSAEVKSVWSPAGESGQVVRQTIRPVPIRAPARLIVVVDGSIGMQKYAREITDALSELPAAMEVAVIIAGDEVQVLNGKPEPVTPAVLTGLARSLRQAQFVGGQDNVPALELAWDLAAGTEHGAIVWIHQPQPALLSAESTLRQHIERDSTTRLYEIQTRNGPDRIMEKLDGLAAVQQVPRFGSVRADLSGLLAEWNGKRARFELARELIAASSDVSAAVRCSKHIVRLWARDETLRLADQRRREEAIQLAARNQLVTPLTGAVVLETQQQFTQNQLTPADPKSVPAVPEPGTISLLALGIAAWLMRRTLRRTRSVG